jgi:hypothetical protein
MTQVDLNFIGKLGLAEQRLLLREAASLLRQAADGQRFSDHQVDHAEDVAERLTWAAQISRVLPPIHSESGGPK